MASLQSWWNISMYFPLFLLFTFATASKCGFESCNKEKPGMINVHVVPHTHNDVGWILTVDEYYYRSVQFIIDTIIPSLEHDPTKRFIYVEIAFFSRWYDEQDDAMRQRVKRLVERGQLEFILGGWCMNDEAATHYSAIIDQHKLGFGWLRETFGECSRPRIGWQIDPFGHSREHASIFSQFGFDGLFFGRLDYQDKTNRAIHNTMEMVWRGSPGNIGNAADLFTGVLPNGYSPPDGFCFDIRCQNIDSKIKDNPKLRGYNRDEKIDHFFTDIYQQAAWYKTNHLIVTMGEDFNYVDADMWFKELDKLIHYVNARQSDGSKVNLLYSTPSCYLKALNDEQLTWPIKTDDFFPYADRPHTFWTGYFTSRPAFKYYARLVNSFFQSAKQMDALAQLDNTHSTRDHLARMAEVLGVAQHHDAISGTATQAVDFDYTQRLTEGMHKTRTVVQAVYDRLLTKVSNASFPDQVFCPYLNLSVCPITQESSQFQVTVYNPLAWRVQQVLRLPVSGPAYTVLASDGKTSLPCDVLSSTSVTRHLGNQIGTSASHELVFTADLEPLGMRTYFVSVKHSDGSLKFSSEKSGATATTKQGSLSGKLVEVEFTPEGHLKSLTDKTSGKTVPLTQNYFYYKGYAGNDSSGEFQSSGAYIFRPQSNKPTPIKLTAWTGVKKGSVVQEAHQKFGDWVSQVIRVYEDKPYVEVEWTVGPIPVMDSIGKEIITRYNIPDLGNHGVFYTDSNGREILKRRLNYRPTWSLDQTEPAAGNYFPVNSLIAIKNATKDVQFTVLTDRSQGGTSLNDGDIEIMLHRRLLADDGKGVGECLDEQGVSGKGLVVRGRHFLLLRPIRQSASLYRRLAKEVFMAQQPTMSSVSINAQTWNGRYHTEWSGLGTALPPNVHLLTLEQFYGTGPVPSPTGTVPYLLRLEHFYEAGEDRKLSKPVTFDIKDLFKPFALEDVHELTLGANLPIDQLKRLNWKTSQNPSGDVNPTRHLKGTVVTLGPMDIVTLQANLRCSEE